MIRKAAKLLFFGNYFLAFCIAVLSLETLVQCGFQQFRFTYFLLIFLLTVVYYTHAYTTETAYYTGSNTRTRWYAQNKLLIKQSQLTAIIISIITAAFFFISSYQHLAAIPVAGWALLLFFPLLALLYYGVVTMPGFTFSLRRYGWLKPFIIGLVASGTVTVYPLILFAGNYPARVSFTTEECLFFTANFLFTIVIAIMFDIKDYAADHNHQLKTLVVQFGLRRTIYYLLSPFIIAGLTACLAFAFLKNYTPAQIILNCLPFLLLAGAAWSLQHRKKILYYLAVIDGLLLVKAICGIAAVYCFR